MKTTLLTLVIGVLAAVPTPCPAAGPAHPPAIPDFTMGGAIPAGAKHDWNLGPTGLRGWMFADKLVTTDARQIVVTKVAAGSPAEGVFLVGDVILGVAGGRFAHDPRTELGMAVSSAESAKGGGKLALTRWRDGVENIAVIKLPVLGVYSATAPYDCAKSRRILDHGCKALAAKWTQSPHKGNPITRSLNALALLASGEPAYLPLVKQEAEWAAGYSAGSMQSWHYGYVMMLLAEYVLATGDQAVMPGLRRLAMETAMGQSAVGSWGHKFALPDGRLGGYGMMNSPGVPLTIALVLAREAGVKDPAVDRAIARSTSLLRFYIGKGAVPYGDHHPWTQTHEDNGKCGMAAVLFNLLGDADGAGYFARMSLASHGPERDTGHTGNFFNLLWAMPGVVQSGPHASGAWMQEFGAWYFDLARQWDGSFPHQGPPESGNDSYAGWDCTGAYLLAYAMPLKKLRLTGKRPDVAPQLDAKAARAIILDGRGWSNKDRISAYDKLSTDQLIGRLGSWSPVVRERAAMALGRRKDVAIEPIVELLGSPRIEARYGACQAVICLGRRGAGAVESLEKALVDPDLWMRIKAAEALAGIGGPAMKTVPKLLGMLARDINADDPRGMQQRYLSFALFDGGGLLGKSLDGVDRDALFAAVRAGLKNQDGRARSTIGSVYRNLSAEEIKPLLPAIYQAIIEPAPSGEMFADGIRMEGLKILAKHRIAEGIPACVNYARQQNPWSSQKRTPELMEILLSYGVHAQAAIPELTKLAEYFAKDEKDFPAELMAMKAKCVRETITAIEASTDRPELLRMK